MPRNITATLEDGTQVVYQNVPDTVKPEEVISRVEKEHGQGVTTLDGGRGNSKADPTTLVGTEKGRYQTRPEPKAPAPVVPPVPVEEVPGLWKTVKSLGADLARGAGQTASFLAEGAAGFNDTQSALGRKSKNDRSYNELTAKVRETLPVPDPSTEGAGRKYVRSALESVGGGAVLPLGGMGLGPTAINAVSGLGAEASAQAFGDNGLTRFLGGLAGGGGASFAGSKLRQVAQPNAISLAKEGLEGILPQELDAAQKLQASARAQGVDMDLVQALEAVGAQGGNLKRIRDVVAGSRRGDNLQKVLQNQPKQLETFGEATIQGLPGKIRQADVAANNLQDAATARIEQARGQRSETWVNVLEEGKARLRDLAKISIAEAQQKLPALEMSVGQARTRLSAAQQELQNLQAAAKTSAGNDAAAVAASNQALAAKAKEVQGLLDGLKTFSLPRGRAVGNQGQLLPMAKRGESIELDMYSRAGQVPSAERKLAEIPAAAKPTTSLETQLALKKETAGQQAVRAAQEELDRQSGVLLQGQQDVAQAKAGLKSVDVVPQPAAQANVDELQALAARYPNTAQGRALQQLAKRLTDAEGQPLRDPAQINQVLKEAAAKLRSPDLATQGVDAGTAKWIGGQINAVRERLGTTFSPLLDANRAYRTATEEVLNPLKKGLVGEFATPRGALPDRAASQIRLQNLLNTGEAVDAKGSNIRTFAKELKKVDPEAFPDALKTYLSKKMGEALPADVTNNLTTPDLAAKLHASLFANRNQFNGLRQAAAASAESFNLNPADVVRGLDNFAQITTALKSRPPGTASMASADVINMGKASMSAEALRTLGLVPFAGAARRINEFRLGQSIKEFDKILTTPEGAARLAALGKAKLGTQQALQAFEALSTAPTQISSGGNAPGITRE
jgi:hypothetical protein